MDAPATPDKRAASSGGFKEKIFGLIEDFWKDPAVEFPPLVTLKLGPRALKIPNLLKPMPRGEAPASSSVPATSAAAAAPAAPREKWHALPGEIAEKMWGEGNIHPLSETMLELMAKPLGLSKEKNILDLTAGLGGPLRSLVGKVNQLKGLEPDPAIAARGQHLSEKAGKSKLAPIEAYDPAAFSMPAIYHCMIARELFYRIPDQGKLFYSIVAGIKEKGRIAFTDFIVDPENRAQPAIAAWQAYEKGARPLGLIEMAEAWAREGVKIHVSDDQTAFYRQDIVNGINRFVSALRHAPHPDSETKQAILREVELWIHRLAAIQAGMKFYRFHAEKT
jgi:hypothetical protein